MSGLLRGQFLLLAATSVLGLAWMGLDQVAQAQTPRPETRVVARRAVTFEPPKGQSRPNHTIGGGKRYDGKCPQDRLRSQPETASQTSQPSLLPLLPTNDPTLRGLGLTTSAHPTVLVYIPATSAQAVEFVLVGRNANRREEGIYQTTVKLTQTPAIVPFAVPGTMPGLEVGKDYEWRVALICQTGDPADAYAEGIIRRVPMDTALVQRLQQAQPVDQVTLYAESGIWYEAVSHLATLRQTQPTNPDLATAWVDLLQSAGLGAVSKTPVLLPSH